jgi:hypothetical protein
VLVAQPLAVFAEEPESQRELELVAGASQDETGRRDPVGELPVKQVIDADCDIGAAPDLERRLQRGAELVGEHGLGLGRRLRELVESPGDVRFQPRQLRAEPTTGQRSQLSAVAQNRVGWRSMMERPATEPRVSGTRSSGRDVSSGP